MAPEIERKFYWTYREELTDEGGQDVDHEGTDGLDVGDVARDDPADSVGDACMSHVTSLGNGIMD